MSGGSGRAGPGWPSWPGCRRSGVRPGVLIEAGGDRFTAVIPERDRVPPGTRRLAGLTLPGLANAHSHAFHRALRGITQAGRGTFWTWRERMYEVAARLDPDSYLALARAVYAEMALAGISCVGEFHYLHHGPGGAAYADPNQMGRALIEAAARAGIRITPAGHLLPGRRPVRGRRASSRCAASSCGSATQTPQPGPPGRTRWAPTRAGVLGPRARVGAAIHSVRAVPGGQLHAVVGLVASRTARRCMSTCPSRWPRTAACLAAYRRTPAEVLYEAGALGPRTTAVHATHLVGRGHRPTGRAASATRASARRPRQTWRTGSGRPGTWRSAGCPLTARQRQPGHRRPVRGGAPGRAGGAAQPQQRGHFTGRASWPGPRRTTVTPAWAGPKQGEIVAGALADLVTVSRWTPRGLAGAAAGTALESVIFAAAAADVRQVVVGGRELVRDGQHLLVDDVPGALAGAIRAESVLARIEP